MKKAKFIKKLTGFTYLELVAAIVIISSGIVVVLRVMPQGMVIANELEYLTKSSMLVDSKIEEIRNEALGTDLSFGFNRDYSGSGSFSDPNDGYRYIVNDDAGGNIKELDVTVWYDENSDGTLDPDEKEININYKLANRGTWN